MPAGVAVPSFVTHYHLADRPPFLSLSDLGDTALRDVLAEQAILRRAGRVHRPFGSRYMELRHLTEARLRELFLARGGHPQRESPHYFVLGESPWFERLAEGMRKVQLSLSALPPDQTTITYPDSFTAMEFGPRFGVPQEPRPYHGAISLLEELADLVARFGVPAPSPDTATAEW